MKIISTLLFFTIWQHVACQMNVRDSILESLQFELGDFSKYGFILEIDTTESYATVFADLDLFNCSNSTVIITGISLVSDYTPIMLYQNPDTMEAGQPIKVKYRRNGLYLGTTIDLSDIINFYNFALNQTTFIDKKLMISKMEEFILWFVQNANLKVTVSGTYRIYGDIHSPLFGSFGRTSFEQSFNLPAKIEFKYLKAIVFK